MTEGEDEGSIPAARLDALTDGVVAIAITLLVLDLRLPEDIAHLDGQAIGRLLLGMQAQFMSYLVSFLVVGTLWINHVMLLRGRRLADGATVWLTIGFLVAVSTLPFTSALLARNHGAVATAVYAGSMALASLFLALLAVRRGPGRGGLSRFAVPLLFLASIGLAFWNSPMARLSWLLIIPLSILGDRRRRSRGDVAA